MRLHPKGKADINIESFQDIKTLVFSRSLTATAGNSIGLLRRPHISRSPSVLWFLYVFIYSFFTNFIIHETHKWRMIRTLSAIGQIENRKEILEICLFVLFWFCNFLSGFLFTKHSINRSIILSHHYTFLSTVSIVNKTHFLYNQKFIEITIKSRVSKNSRNISMIRKYLDNK